MKEKLNIYYDKDADYLEINIGKTNKGDFVNLGRGIFERVDQKTGKVLGIAIHNFLKKTSLKNIEIDLPSKIELSS